MADFRLDTERLYLREIVKSDLDFIARLRADEEVMRYYPSTLTRDQAMEYIQRTLQRYKDDGVGHWLAIDRVTEQPVGCVGILMQNVHDEKLPEIGYIFWKEYWRQGLASEAALAVKKYAFETLNHPFVISLIREVNIPSQGVARRMGMQRWKSSMHADLEHIVFRVDKNGETSWANSGY